MSCITCDSEPPPCACSETQTCFQFSRNCTHCPFNVCRDSITNQHSGLGPTVGAALGGVLGGLALLAVSWWLWRQGVFDRLISHASSKDITFQEAARRNRQRPPRQSAKLIGNEVEASEAQTSALPGAESKSVKRLSTLLLDSIEERPEPDSTSTLNLRIEGRGSGDLLGLYKQGALGSPLSDDPFADSFSIASKPPAVRPLSDFSYRSSHSTNIIPIAYIPPASKSLSITDAAERDAFGNRSPVPVPGPSTNAAAVEVLERRSSNSSSFSTAVHALPTPPMSATGKPIRPPRAPGLDLKLPTSPLAVATPGGGSSTPPPTSGSARTESGFPWSVAANTVRRHSMGEVPPASAVDSRFSTSTHNSRRTPRETDSQIWADGPPSASRHVSLLRSQGSQEERRLSVGSHSRLSTMSDVTSNDSHLSSILDPAMIVTPVTLVRTASGKQQAVQRVRLAGQERARVVRLPPSSTSASPSTPTGDTLPMQPSGYSLLSQLAGTGPLSPSHGLAPVPENPFSDSAATSGQCGSPTTPKATSLTDRRGVGKVDLRDPALQTHAIIQIGVSNPGSRASDMSEFPATAVPYTPQGVISTFAQMQSQLPVMRIGTEKSHHQAMPSDASAVSLWSSMDGRAESISSDGSFMDQAHGIERISSSAIARSSNNRPIPPSIPNPPLNRVNQGVNYSAVPTSSSSLGVSPTHTLQATATSPSTDGGYDSLTNGHQSPSSMGSTLIADTDGSSRTSQTLNDQYMDRSEFLKDMASSRLSGSSVVSAGTAISNADSYRTGYGSVLEDIPFNIGIGGFAFGTSQRGSITFSDNETVRGEIDDELYGGGSHSRVTSRAFSMSSESSGLFSRFNSVGVPLPPQRSFSTHSRTTIGKIDDAQQVASQSKSVHGPLLTSSQQQLQDSAASTVPPLPTTTTTTTITKNSVDRERNSTSSLALSAEIALSFSEI